MTRTAPAPGFLPGERVTLNHPTQGTLRLVVRETQPNALSPEPTILLTLANGSGMYRATRTELQRGWGN